LITTHLEELVAEPVDVVIELLGGDEPARTLTSKALRLGRHVVTANKALLARDLGTLQRLASHSGVALKYSAAVGGVLPALETVNRARTIAPLHSISGVLNGTTNFILDQLANGSDLADAVSAAQKSGYAEHDSQLDLNGTDAAQKLILLARAAFDVDLPLSSIEKRGIQHLNAKQVRDARNDGRITRLAYGTSVSGRVTFRSTTGARHRRRKSLAYSISNWKVLGRLRQRRRSLAHKRGSSRRFA
jgi:homoserine dehydrogenase